MTDAPDPQSHERERIVMIDEEEQALALPRFGIDNSWWLGCRLRALAIERGLSLAIEIRRGPTLLFSCLTGSASQDQFEWIRRKAAVALRFERSSYAIGLRCNLNPALFQRSGLTFEHHVAAGGAVPVRLEGTGVIGVVAISGLPQEEDHRLAVQGLRELQERLRHPQFTTAEA